MIPDREETHFQPWPIETLLSRLAPHVIIVVENWMTANARDSIRNAGVMFLEGVLPGSASEKTGYELIFSLLGCGADYAQYYSTPESLPALEDWLHDLGWIDMRERDGVVVVASGFFTLTMKQQVEVLESFNAWERAGISWNARGKLLKFGLLLPNV